MAATADSTLSPTSPTTTSFSTRAFKSGAAPLSRRLATLVASSGSLDSNPDTLKALGALAEVCDIDGGSTKGVGGAGRALGVEAEKAALESLIAFLDAFKKVVQDVERLDSFVETMRDDCSRMESDVEVAQRKTSHLVKLSSSLKQQVTSTTLRRELSERFISRFTLSDAEVALLTSPLTSSSPVSSPMSLIPPSHTSPTSAISPGIQHDSKATGIGPAFFAALERVEVIGRECEVLLAGESQVAGTDLLNNSAQLVRSGLTKLQRWACDRTRLLVDEEPDVPQGLQVAAKWLRKEQGGLEAILTSLSSTRRPLVVQAFLHRLTLAPRPLELHAPDPPTYAAAMLAWVHQRAAGEREVVEAVVEEARSDSRKEGLEQVVDKAVERAVGECMEGCVGAIKPRIEHILSSTPHALTIYKIANVLQFYGATIEKVLGRTGKMYAAIDELRETAYRVFFQAMEHYTDRVVRSIQPPDRSLQPQSVLLSLLSDLRALLATYDASLVSLPGGRSREDDFAPALGAALDPVLEGIERSGAGLGVWERGVYGINCLGEVQSVLLQYPFTAGRAEAVESMIEGTIDVMSQEEYMTMLRDSKLHSIVETVDGNNGSAPLSSLSTTTPSTLASIMLHLDSYLASHDPSARLARISSSRAARSVERRACELFVLAYGRVYDAVRKPENGYEWPETVVGRKVGEVETLLGVDD